MLNGSIDFIKDKDVSVVTTQVTTNTLSVLTWNNVSQAKSQGNYSCLAKNHYGIARWNFDVSIACEYIEHRFYCINLQSEAQVILLILKAMIQIPKGSSLTLPPDLRCDGERLNESIKEFYNTFYLSLVLKMLKISVTSKGQL